MKSTLLKKPCPTLVQTSVFRSGATLSEVLVALLIMAIGVVSLASLFPISVLKTARASQLTTATDICHNARSWLEVYPHIVTDPDPTDSNADGAPFNDVGFLPAAYIFDPLALAPGRPLPMDPFVGAIPRLGAGFQSNMALAESICSGPDNWTTIHEAPVTSIDATRTQVTVDSLATVTLPSTPLKPNQVRVHLTFSNGKRSITRPVTNILAGNVLVVSEDFNTNGVLDSGEDFNGNNGLDTHVIPNITFESARIEVHELRYSWALTVTTDGYTATSKRIVVYFGRSFDPTEEQIYGNQPTNGISVPRLISGSSFTLQGGVNAKTFILTWPGGQDSAPYLKRGGWILDALSGSWYQIESFSDPTGATSSTITLMTNLKDPSGLFMFPKGVVDVY